MSFGTFPHTHTHTYLRRLYGFLYCLPVSEEGLGFCFSPMIFLFAVFARPYVAAPCRCIVCVGFNACTYFDKHFVYKTYSLVCVAQKKKTDYVKIFPVKIYPNDNGCF